MVGESHAPPTMKEIKTYRLCQRMFMNLESYLLYYVYNSTWVSQAVKQPDDNVTGQQTVHL